MDEPKPLFYKRSIYIAAPAAMLYEMVADITRTGEWSPVCTSCWWDDPAEVRTVGAWFTGHNEGPGRTWETRSKVVVADRSCEFAFVVGGTFVRWGYTFVPRGSGTEVTESWQFLPEGIAMFEKKYGDNAAAPDGVQHIFSAFSPGNEASYAGLMVIYGQVVTIDGPLGMDISALKEKSQTWHWESMITTPQFEPDSTAQRDLLDAAAALFDEGVLQSTLTRTLSPLTADTLREAHKLVEGSTMVGKVAVVAEWD